jgi:Ribonuclease G/E
MAKMASKNVKKVVESTDNIDSLKEEWLTVVKEVTTLQEKLKELDTRQQSIVSRIWTLMNKNPSEVIIDSKEQSDEVAEPVKKKSVRKSKKVETETSDEPVKKPVRKSPVKKTEPVVEEEKQVKKKVSAPKTTTKKNTPPPVPEPVNHESSSDTDLDSLSSVSSESEASGGED